MLTLMKTMLPFVVDMNTISNRQQRAIYVGFTMFQRLYKCCIQPARLFEKLILTLCLLYCPVWYYTYINQLNKIITSLSTYLPT